jgi:AraC-like DNA-binding protein
MIAPLILLHTGLAHQHADWNWQNVRSPFARIYYIVEGNAQVLLPDKMLDLRAGHLYLIPPFTTHHYVCKGHFVHYYVHFYEKSEVSPQGIFDEWDMPNESDSNAGDLSLFKHLCQLMPDLQLQASDPETYDNHSQLIEMLKEENRRPLHERMEVQGILQILLSRFLRYAHQRLLLCDRRIQQTLTYIHRHLGDRIELDKLAEETCVSKDHLIRLFKQATGETPVNYIIRRKLEQAELLLTTTSMSVKNIAAELGYDDTSYFIRVFRKHSNMSPQEYRNTWQEV